MATSSRAWWVAATLAIIALVVAIPKIADFVVAAPPKVEQPGTCDIEQVVTDHLLAKGFKPNSFQLIDEGFKPKPTDEVRNAGDGAFSESAILSTRELDEFLKKKDGRAGLASKVVAERLDGREASWVGVRFKNKIDVKGNLGIKDGKVHNYGTRKSAAGDVFFFPVDIADCSVVDGLVIRAGCGNPGADIVCTENCAPCPPGGNRNDNGVCVTPKSDDPDDYRRPGDGGKGDDVGRGTKPRTPKTHPLPKPKVETKAVGGGGVVDSPTKDPGSETGGTAPDAETPVKKPVKKPANQGGSNDGETDSF